MSTQRVHDRRGTLLLQYSKLNDAQRFGHLLPPNMYGVYSQPGKDCGTLDDWHVAMGYSLNTFSKDGLNYRRPTAGLRPHPGAPDGSSSLTPLRISPPAVSDVSCSHRVLCFPPDCFVCPSVRHRVAESGSQKVQRESEKLYFHTSVTR